MAQVKIYGDIDSASIFFINSTVEPKAMGTIVASLKSDEDRIVIRRTDRFDPDGISFRTIFRRLNPSRVQNRDGQDLVGTLGYSTQEIIDYINAQANLQGTTGGDSTGTDLTGLSVCFKLDDTSTSVMMSNGFEFGVNTIKAVANDSGFIDIKSELGDRTHFSNLEAGLACKGEDDSVISGGLNDVVNYLNELFTVGAFESVVISDPYATMVADTTGVVTTETNVTRGDAIEVQPDEYGATTSGYNNGGYITPEVINQAGEYFTFDVRNEGIIGFGLVVSDDDFADGKFNGNSSYADPSTFCSPSVPNSGNYGYQFSHWFHPSPNGPWTNYGANTAYSQREGWSNIAHRFISSPEGAKWLNGDVIRMRVGINENNFIVISYFDESTSLYVPISRTTYAVPNGNDFHLGVKFGDSTVRLVGIPRVHLLATDFEEPAPTMYFRYIESPDGVFHYPLFTTAAEAEYYDKIINGGDGFSHTHTYADDATNTTWYMPEANHDASIYTFSSAPDGTETFNGNAVNYTEITSLTNSDLTPSVFSGSDYTYEEGTVINLQLQPQDVAYTTSVDISPAGSGLVFSNGYLLQGTLNDVSTNTVYTVTVTRANSYGSSVGSFTITATDVAPVQTNDTSWNKALDFSGSSERGQQVGSHGNYMPVALDGISALAAAPTVSGNTSGNIYSRPWATAIVFRADGNNSNQHIWNQGEGASSTQDNIYLRMDANGQLYFGWGRDGALNECAIGSATANKWYGVYIAHNGTRLSGSDATAANLAAAFDIRITSETGNWTGATYNYSKSFTWSTNGGRMDRSVVGHLTIGGRGSNRNFHGKVASFVSTTLRINQPMPTTAEIELMISDPTKWLNDYKDGNTYRVASGQAEATFGLFNYLSNSAFATQVWLMGDGTNDSYSNMIRNQVYANDQNYTKLNLISMVSNDIQSVSINGLT